jgi:hypothetical protein
MANDYVNLAKGIRRQGKAGTINIFLVFLSWSAGGNFRQ